VKSVPYSTRRKTGETSSRPGTGGAAGTGRQSEESPYQVKRQDGYQVRFQEYPDYPSTMQPQPTRMSDDRRSSQSAARPSTSSGGSGYAVKDGRFIFEQTPSLRRPSTRDKDRAGRIKPPSSSSSKDKEGRESLLQSSGGERRPKTREDFLSEDEKNSRKKKEKKGRFKLRRCTMM
jgi:hypothetical protein